MAEEANISVEAAFDDHVEDEQGPIRHCAETRVRLPKAALIRFALGPGDNIVPDLAERLPGRGVWISCDREVVAAAVRSKAFSRSLKRKANADADLPARVEVLMLRRALDALSIANKSGFVITGFAKVEAAAAVGSLSAVLHAADGSDEGADKLDRRFRAVCRDAGVPAIVVKLLTIEQLSLALGRSNVVHAGLGSGGAAHLFLSEIERLERFRGSHTGSRTEGMSAGRNAARA